MFPIELRVAPEIRMQVSGNPTAHRWNREDGYQSNIAESATFPYRTFSSNMFGSLMVNLGFLVNRDEYVFNKSPSSFSIVLYSPDDLPHEQKNVYVVSLDEDVFISIRATAIKTSNGLRSYEPHGRGCFFNSERKLRYFKSYSFQKCQLECLTNHTEQLCKCVHFSMPS